MRTIGIGMLFGLCTLIGFRIGARKTVRLITVRELRSDLQLFTERILSGGGTLVEWTAEQHCMLSEQIGAYLDLLIRGEGDADAAAHAAGKLNCCQTARAGVERFLIGLHTASRNDLLKRAQILSSVLERAETEAEAEAKQARVLKISGVLAGAGLAILLW